MVSVSEADQILSGTSYKLSTLALPVENVVNRVLAETVVADRDFPPFDRVAMDGIAINARAFAQKKAFKIESVQAAGVPRLSLQHSENCIEVMTGATVPEGTDAVIRYEDVDIAEGHASIRLDHVSTGMNIHYQGSDVRKDEVVLSPGQVLSPAEIALLASVGKTEVHVYEFPRTAIISSGNELVEIGTVPEPHQIRRSNAYALQAAMLQLGWQARLYHLPDDRFTIHERLQHVLLGHDVVILSGGVSKGKFDFIPEALNDLGIQKLFHQVSQKPGKPFWFGKSASNKIVFALPGNPVSTFLCFYRYIKPWIHNQMQNPVRVSKAKLASSFEFSPPLTYYLQVRVENENGTLVAYPIPGGGSGDFANLAGVSGFLELPSSLSHFSAGEVFDYYFFR
ncbi:MAG: molybdopterin molybdotransferase MoeA [Cyclobacteriaceae bacterium]|nr:molybdopterin molybdotransferase MoeA [Cyclobacteriaceae bacterium]UYN88099.1 MAG: molybdopterin molybdotransferase MoeA [Cyclobacteriaceae bacterium]